MSKRTATVGPNSVIHWPENKIDVFRKAYAFLDEVESKKTGRKTITTVIDPNNPDDTETCTM